jgi:hypothetical protein
MGRFVAAHLSGGSPLIAGDSAREMQRVHASEGPPTSGMGLGWRVTRSNGHHLICHGGDGAGNTNFMGAYPELGVGIVLTLNRAAVAAARSVIANTVLGMLSEADARPSVNGGVDKIFEGAYRSTYWEANADVRADGDTPTITVTDGLIVSDGGEPTRLTPLSESIYAADGGILHGFEICMDTLVEGPAFAGGLYPFSFKRTGEIEEVEELAPDETADLTGHWRGTAVTPLGPLLIEFDVVDETHAKVSTPFGRDLLLEECRVSGGRLAGRFAMTVPTVGDLIVHPRFVATGGKLRGSLYAWGVFGETALPAELEKVASTVHNRNTNGGNNEFD